MGDERHGGVGWELVVDTSVPQLGWDLTVLPDLNARRFLECTEVLGGMYGPEVAQGIQGIFAQAAARREMPREPEDGEARSSNKMGKKGKRRKRRKKKLPKSSSSFLHGLRGGMGDQGILFEYAKDENEEVAEYSGWVDTAPCMKEIGEFIEDKVVRTEEFIHKHGQLVKIMYGDRLHLYTQSSGSYWLDCMKERWRYVRRRGCLRRWTGMLLTSSCSHDCCEERVEQTLSEDSHGTPV